MTPHLAEYQDIQQQIAKLQERAEALVTKGRIEAIDSIKAMINIYGLTGADIGIVAKAPARPARTAKYRDPVSGDTWTGQGREPKWLEGKAREPFVITMQQGRERGQEVRAAARAAAQDAVPDASATEQGKWPAELRAAFDITQSAS